MERLENLAGGTPRARRFVVRLPARYRQSATEPWRKATTINVSCTGVLFRSAEPLASGTIVAFNFALTRKPGQTLSGRVLCRCRVARVETSPAGEPGIAVAAAIVSHKIRPRHGRAGGIASDVPSA